MDMLSFNFKERDIRDICLHVITFTIAKSYIHTSVAEKAPYLQNVILKANL